MWWCERHQRDLALCPRVWLYPCKPMPGSPDLRERLLPERSKSFDLLWMLVTVTMAVYVLVGFLEVIQ